ncbi:GEL complex subunit OPTI isoform X2 [Monodelphis domestica]|uniref:GEL complex subunit OPTI isoform X2 n=1 Tax=Monodelphis domestica TaxID=13616 RepID=UPI00044320CD|nr:GEL complex subunit OPTI isoform X2 [Monodelphis domestica]
MSGGRRKEEPPQPHLANGAPKSSAWSKALRSDAAWEDKDEFLDVIYWFRQIIAVVLGVIWGVVPLKGFVGIAVLFGSSFTLPSTTTDRLQPTPASPVHSKGHSNHRPEPCQWSGAFATRRL